MITGHDFGHDYGFECCDREGVNMTMQSILSGFMWSYLSCDIVHILEISGHDIPWTSMGR
jgi:hypothetical protein